MKDLDFSYICIQKGAHAGIFLHEITNYHLLIKATMDTKLENGRCYEIEKKKSYNYEYSPEMDEERF